MSRNYPNISINIVAWNSMRFLPDLLDSIQKQTFRDFHVLVIDNGSTDGVETFVREQYPTVAFLRNAKNLGFAVAHNQGIRYALDRWDPSVLNDRFVLVTNPDSILTETFLEELVREMQSDVHIGSCGGKLLRAFGEHQNDEVLCETVKSDLLDSTGLRPKKNGTCHDRGAGEMDTGQFDQAKDVFGISGALVLYRASALQDARYQDEFFDQDFFSYKEDVDLAWRLQWLGHSARYVPSARAYHYRGMYGRERLSIWQRFKHRRTKSLQRSYYSTRNQWLLLVKNMHVSNGIIWFPRIVMTEGLRWLFTLFFETKNMRSFLEALVLFPRMLKKRWNLMKRRTCTAKEMRKWFV